MRPEARSQRLLSITRSKAKMYEYGVPEEYHIDIPRDPARLFTLAIGLLGDLAFEICSQDVESSEENIPFSSHFFDAYLESRLNQELDPYLILMGSKFHMFLLIIC